MWMSINPMELMATAMAYMFYIESCTFFYDEIFTQISFGAENIPIYCVILILLGDLQN